MSFGCNIKTIFNMPGDVIHNMECGAQFKRVMLEHEMEMVLMHRAEYTRRIMVGPKKDRTIDSCAVHDIAAELGYDRYEVVGEDVSADGSMTHYLELHGTSLFVLRKEIEIE